MKKRITLAVALILATFGISNACTNFIVAKGASVDGSTMVTYAADSYWLYGSLYHYPAPAFSESSVETLTRVVERYREIGAFAASPVMTQEAYERLLDIMQQAGELDTRAPYEAVINNGIAEKVIAE